MRIIYGVKILTHEDLFEHSSDIKSIRDFIEDNSAQILNDLNEVSLSFIHRNTYQSQDFNFRFIPLEVIEKYITYFLSQKELLQIKQYAISNNVLEKSQKNVINNKKKLDTAIEKYICKDITNKKCVIIAIDKYGKIKDVKICIPNNVICKIKNPVVYECSKCHHKEYSDILPDDMYYEIKNNEIEYFCSKCKTKKSVHVGESFYK